MERNDDDDCHRSSRRGPHFFMGSTDDPNEFLEDVVTSVGGAGRRRANDYDTVLMDAFISCCDKRLTARAGCFHNGESMVSLVLLENCGMP